MESTTVYHLSLELSYPSGCKIESSNNLRLAKALKGIKRDILIPGSMPLSRLHPIIQIMFGWHNLHLHKFSLEEPDFDCLTERKDNIYESLCGALFRYNTKTSSAWRWHVLFGNPLYGLPSLTPEYPAADSLFVNQHNILEHHDPCIRFYPHGSHAELAFTSEANILLDRLRIDELLLSGYEQDGYAINYRQHIPEWRKSLLGTISQSMDDILTFQKSDPVGFLRCRSALTDLEAWKISFASLLNICNDPAEVRSQFGCTTKEAFEMHRNRILECYKCAHKLIDLYNPVITPYFRTLNYWYDKGDEWLVRITCRNIFSLVSVHDVRTPASVRILREDSGASNGYTASEKHYMKNNSLKSGGCGQAKYRWIDKYCDAAPSDISDKLDQVFKCNKPACIAVDGLNVMENIGGVKGFFDFLHIMNTSNSKAIRRMQKHARYYGWDDRIPVPDELLKTYD